MSALLSTIFTLMITEHNLKTNSLANDYFLSLCFCLWHKSIFLKEFIAFSQKLSSFAKRNSIAWAHLSLMNREGSSLFWFYSSFLSLDFMRARIRKSSCLNSWSSWASSFIFSVLSWGWGFSLETSLFWRT